MLKKGMVNKLSENIMFILRLFLMIVLCLYFFILLKDQFCGRSIIYKESTEELERIRKINKISLTKPLTEKTRPKNISEIIGQEEGVKALKVALCGKNPQHVIIYGPPGVGKTAASRIILDEAKKNPLSPFSNISKFIELDATTLQYDERCIADPLIGSVHDPIYQGAGAYGQFGVPIPKEGAVTKAHGGILFLDEIGELCPIQMNRLLKVLEDRRVYFDSSYYSERNKDIPRHIHEIFKNGLPADFRLIGATTKRPEDMPPALRSRCVEIFFSPLSREDIFKIVLNAMKKFEITDNEIADFITDYAICGRDAVKIVQTAVSLAEIEGRPLTKNDAKWVVSAGRFLPVLHENKKNEGVNLKGA